MAMHTGQSIDHTRGNSVHLKKRPKNRTQGQGNFGLDAPEMQETVSPAPGMDEEEDNALGFGGQHGKQANGWHYLYRPVHFENNHARPDWSERKIKMGIPIAQFNREEALEVKSIRDQAARVASAPRRLVSARDLCHHIGLPEMAIGLIQRVLNAETEIMLLHEDIKGLKARLSKLENKV